MNWKSVVCVVLCAVLAPAAELPVRTVVLYKHGVGYFERGGTLGPGESARLDFKAEEMNDVLKSLTVNEQNGKVTGLRYDSSIPLSQKLTEFPFTVGSGASLSAIVDQFKGARIEMDFGSQHQHQAGTVVSARLIEAEKDRPEREQLTLLLDSGELRNVDLNAATAIRFADPKLQLQFKDYLGALSGARSKDKRSVYIDSSDAQSRNVQASYIMPMPAWKSSYRLLFGTENAQPVLEGWAIVDNTTGEDWTNIHLSLVSGKPISFVSQLYAPKYITRLGAELAEENPVAPTVFTGAIAAQSAPPPPPAQRKGAGIIGGVAGGALSDLAKLPSAAFNEALLQAQSGTPSSVVSANGTEIADLFEYTIANPVTVKKDESAMMPFLQQKISARKLVIYSDQSKPNPFNAAELSNNTGKTLDGGPITVYDAGAYAGEALVETVKSGDKRFISYGVDLGTRIATNFDSKNAGTLEVHVHNGMLTAKSAMIDKKTYSAHNVDARAKTLIIEHPVRPGYTLLDTPKPFETARDVYRFEIKLPANGTIDFPVTEQRVYDSQTSISSLNPDGLLVYVRNTKISDAARRQLQQIADLKTQLVSLDNQKRSLNDDIANLTRDEERNRQNIQSLSNVSRQQQIVQDYARRLTEQETQIAKLRDQIAGLDRQRVTLQTQLNGQIENLDF